MDNDMTDTKPSLTLKLEQDINPLNPREEWENMGTMALFHKRYTLGDKGHGLCTSDFEGWEAMEDHLYRNCGAVVVLQVFMYDHSGITIRTSPFSCPWDSGQIGFIYVTREKALATFNRKRITQKLIGKLTDALVSEVKTYDQYLTGDVWSYVIEDDKGEHIDSCGGFFGHDYAVEEGEQALAFFQKAAA